MRPIESNDKYRGRVLADHEAKINTGMRVIDRSSNDQNLLQNSETSLVASDYPLFAHARSHNEIIFINLSDPTGSKFGFKFCSEYNFIAFINS